MRQGIPIPIGFVVSPVKMTFLGREPFESEYNTAQYQCHLSEPDNIAATAHVESFRAVWTRNDANENVDPPVPVWIDDIIYKHWKVTLDNYGNNDAFGVFGCEAALDGRISTSISGIFMRSDADIVPSDELVSVTANAGDTGVSIGMKSTGLKNVADFRWSKDNVRNNAFNGDDTWVISGQVEVDDAGVYECHINNERSDAKQGLKLLIVREFEEDFAVKVQFSSLYFGEGEEFLSPLRKFVTPGVGGYKADFGLTLVIFSGEKFDLCFTRLWLEVRLLFWSIAGKKVTAVSGIARNFVEDQ
ncbi:putative tyrosine-protein kinase [Apostichopus japonicus]|uniref:Putative tyrosine-protein kinase n=1 Tax=Stichopus japonicus TaxID=307972 RepID=A0A2G8JEC4_STIJA|nr:putative tyrosine-protein kinase [Apostichopus japonicus]